MRFLKWLGFMLAATFLVLTFVNASWMADAPRGRAGLIAWGGGVHQEFTTRNVGGESCAPAEIAPPVHRYIADTLPSIRMARQLGAAMIAVDVQPTSDGQIVAFPDATLDCRTDGNGKVRDHTLAQLQQLDPGYRLTADKGKTFPFRGTQTEAIPSLEQVIAAAKPKPLVYIFRSSDPRDADALAAALKALGRDPVAEGDAFYAEEESGPVSRIRELYPQSWAFSAQGAAACASAYKTLGWFGATPSVCTDRTLIMPLSGQWVYAGWPNKLLARMKAAGSHVVMGTTDHGFGGLDLPEQLGSIPRDFNGYIRVDDIWTVAPALFPDTDPRSNAEREQADKALARKRAAQ